MQYPLKGVNFLGVNQINFCEPSWFQVQPKEAKGEHRRWRFCSSADVVVVMMFRGMSEGDVPPEKVELFLENVGLNESIWCTISHHVKHLTACLLGRFFYFRTGRSKKWRGHAPQSEKWRSHWPPWPPGSATRRKCWRSLVFEKAHNREL